MQDLICMFKGMYQIGCPEAKSLYHSKIFFHSCLVGYEPTFIGARAVLIDNSRGCWDASVTPDGNPRVCILAGIHPQDARRTPLVGYEPTYVEVSVMLIDT